MSFAEYLSTRKGLSPASVSHYLFHLKGFQTWWQQQGFTESSPAYAHLLLFIEHEQQQGQSKRYINDRLRGVRHWLDYQLEQGLIGYNPAQGLHLRGIKRPLPGNLLEREEMDALYEHYPHKDERSHRNKVILGLLVFQGLPTGEISRLTVENLDFPQSQVHLPASSRSNGRSLPLEASQLLPLLEYVQQVRPRLLSTLPQAGDLLLFTLPTQSGWGGGLPLLKNAFHWLMKELKEYNPKVKNAAQLRQSVITHWLTQHDVRLVQHLAGHRHVDSTERYQTDYLLQLQADLDKYHPL